MSSQFGDKTLSGTRVFAWHKKFKKGQEVGKTWNIIDVLGPALQMKTFVRFETFLKTTKRVFE